MESDYQDASEDSLAEHLEAVPPVVGGLVVCGWWTTYMESRMVQTTTDIM